MPDELWALVEPLIPTFRLRAQSGGTAPLDDRAGVHGGRVCAEQQRMAGTRALVRSSLPDRVSPLRPVDQGRAGAGSGARLWTNSAAGFAWANRLTMTLGRLTR